MLEKAVMKQLSVYSLFGVLDKSMVFIPIVLEL